MRFETKIERGIVINRAGDQTSLPEVLAYVAQHGIEWHGRQVLWDVRRFPFETLNADGVRTMVQDGAQLSTGRAGLRTAILVESDLGFGMMRMLEMIADEILEFEIGVFRSEKTAVAWLEEQRLPP